MRRWFPFVASRLVSLGMIVAVSAAAAATLLPVPTSAQAPSKRPMTFLDALQLRTASLPTLSPDLKWALYSISSLDWKEGKRHTDLWVTPIDQGATSARQLTFTRDKNEHGARWAPDGRFFLFLSDRDAPATTVGQEQLYLMRPDGGEARRLTDAKDGVGNFDLSRDGKWLVYAAGKADDRQLWALRLAGIDTAQAAQLTKHASPIDTWQFSWDGSRIYFLAADSLDKDDKTRVEKKFDARLRNEVKSPVHLWALDIAQKRESRLTRDPAYSVSDVTFSRDGKWLGFRGTPNDRYLRTVTETTIYGDLYLLETSSGKIERLTNNTEIAESELSFSPDGVQIAFSASDDFAYFRNTRVYLRPVSEPTTAWRKLGTSFDGDVSVEWWSDDGKTIYFNEGIKATEQVLALNVLDGSVRQLTTTQASTFASRTPDRPEIFVLYSDPVTPTDYYLIGGSGQLSDRSQWKRLTRANPLADDFLIGASEEVSWKSADGKMVGGILLKPVGYQPGRRYPLIVQIHGGPAGADRLSYNEGYESQVYAGESYVVLMPNYRGSSNYGERHRSEIAGNYFQRGYEDIMTGVDWLIAQGLVHPDSLGVMGWSAGGHWSNWILTHTTRFKAISSGAGTMNWISMYAQSDIQRNRQFYLGGKLPYDDFEAYWKVSPLKYIKNARTPTLIHVVDGDPRVPRPQSEELHMALKKLGVPTEFFVYPGTTHGIPDPRNRLLKAVAEFRWFEKWIRGKPGWFHWRELLKTLDDTEEKKN